MEDPFDLQRFVDAQAPVLAVVEREQRAGRKASHWIWFIFPQAAGLGRSAMSTRYAIRSQDEAAAYLAHPTLGPRLKDCTEMVLSHSTGSLEAIFGDLDALKFRSCMDLFRQVAGEASVFARALAAFPSSTPKH